MAFASQAGRKGEPPGLRSVSGPFDWCVGGEEGGKSREMAVEPGLEGDLGWKLRGHGEDQVAQKGGEGVSVSQGPIRRRNWWGEDRMRNSNGDGNVVRTS